MSAYEIQYINRFDIAFSIGVIHHLERPDFALQQMVKALKPGGLLLIWVYGFENNRWILTFLNPVRKALFSRLPISVVHHLSLYPTALLWALLRIGTGKVEYFNLIRRVSFRQLRSIVFDQMLPNIANYWSRDEIDQMMHNAGLKDVKLAWVNQVSWSALGIKPSTRDGGKQSN
jgi:SAM-dependent methyltransferase